MRRENFACKQKFFLVAKARIKVDIHGGEGILSVHIVRYFVSGGWAALFSCVFLLCD